MAAVSADITNIGIADWYTDEIEEFIAGLEGIFTVEIEDGWNLQIYPMLMEDYTWFYCGQLNESGSGGEIACQAFAWILQSPGIRAGTAK